MSTIQINKNLQSERVECGILFMPKFIGQKKMLTNEN